MQQAILQVGRVHIGDVVAGDIALEWSECLGDKTRPKIGTANTDVHNIGNCLTGKAFPRATVDTLRPLLHQCPGRLHLLKFVFETVTARGSQQGVQCRSVFRVIDVLATQQRGDLRLQPRIVCQTQQAGQGLAVHQLFGIIQL